MLQFQRPLMHVTEHRRVNPVDKRFEHIEFPWLAEKLEQWDKSLMVSKATHRSYASGMLALIRYAEKHNLAITSLRKDDIYAFREWMLSSDYKSSTIALYLAGIRSFYRFLGEEDETKDIARRVKGPNTPKSFKKDALSRNQVQELLASIDRSSLKGLRDFALINLMVRTGLRDIEVSRAVFWDIDFGMDPDTAVLHVQGKGKTAKDDYVVLDEKALEPIRTYLVRRQKEWNKKEGNPENAKALDDTAPLFASLSNNSPGAPLTTRSISRIVKGRLRAIGLNDPKYTAHSLRHTAVTLALLGGASVQETQAMARHADISTTLIYAHNLDRINNPAEAKAGSYLDLGEHPATN